ncbi:hypothetical protein [uncultured Maritimibacter sp.]|uniref:HNH endonuclease n=1 Tax=uncultured Maritimibacter sp. TaxID=991866 RepID=UPI002596F797|nr:hypothetical protein [uncultured Maritimibacter sp.]
MSRKKFIMSLGASCKNWNWSWSFVNHSDQCVYFGAWKEELTARGQVILSETWGPGTGNTKAAYREATENVQLVEKDGYRLFTFPMERKPTSDGSIKIGKLTPEITPCLLERIGTEWFAQVQLSGLPPSLTKKALERLYSEGGKQQKLVTRYERDNRARRACLRAHGFDCATCGANLMEIYGEVARDFIHVHHLTRLSDMGDDYRVNPKRDMRPLCPNCHSIAHLRVPPFSLAQIREFLKTSAC